jgi:heme exporter protein CcmD
VTEFFAMGGYAAYVWTAYGITAAVIVLNVWSAQRRYHRAMAAISAERPSVEPARKPTVRKVS